MTAFIDTRPAGVDLYFRPGNTFDVNIEFETGALAGRTFEATLDGTALDLEIAADTMTVTATPAVTAAAAEAPVFNLTETTGGLSQEILVGKWSRSEAAGASRNAAVTVVETAGGTVNVSASSGVRRAVYRINPWSPAGHAPGTWSAHQLSADAGMPDPPTLRYRFGRVEVIGSGAMTSNSNRRDFFVPSGLPSHADGRIRSVWWGTLARPGQTAAIRPQHGHVHRFVDDGGGVVRGLTVWHDILFGAQNLINVNMLGGDGAGNLVQGTGAVALGQAAFTGGARASNSVTLTGLPSGHGFQIGDVVVVDAGDNTYDGTFTLTAVADTTVTYAQTAADDPGSLSGTIRLAGPSTSGLPGVGRTVTVSASARANGLVTATVPAGHGISPGEQIQVDVATAAFDGIYMVQSVTSTTVVWAQAGTDGSGGAGSIVRFFPYVVESELVDDVVLVSAWPYRPGSPDDGTGASTWPTSTGDPMTQVVVDVGAVTGPALPARGRSGLFVGHTASTSMCRFSNLEVEVYR